VPLQIDRHGDGSRAVLATNGELDLATAPLLASEALELIEDGARDVIVDLSGLTFCDSSGLSAFVRIANRLNPSAGRLVLAGPTAIVRRVLDVSGLDMTLVVVDDMEAAVAALG
jgi:anti-sigma B factor antagonist